jgi:homotetrameric cytidine deaminase
VVDDDEALGHGRDDNLAGPLDASTRNVELKARDPDPARTLERALALGAEDMGEIRQVDTYFAGARGRLKLREQETDGPTLWDELIEYSRPDSTDARTSNYTRVPVADAEPLREALDSAYGTLATVTKRRRLLLWHGVRIHLDEVEGLGSFLEFEAVADTGPDLTAERERVEHLRAELEVDDANLIATSYSDLVLETSAGAGAEETAGGGRAGETAASAGAEEAAGGGRAGETAAGAGAEEAAGGGRAGETAASAAAREAAAGAGEASAAAGEAGGPGGPGEPGEAGEGAAAGEAGDPTEELLRAAEAVMRTAHAPYSRFAVGAALRGADGRVYAGSNVENASYPQGQCAETSAIGALIAAGQTEITEVAVVAESVDFCPPCGGCRQRLAELADPETQVHLGKPGGPRMSTTVGELLPLAFEFEPPG